MKVKVCSENPKAGNGFFSKKTLSKQTFLMSDMQVLFDFCSLNFLFRFSNSFIG